MRLKFILFTLIIHCFFIHVGAQKTVFEQTKSHHQDVAVSKVHETDAQITDFILTEIARAFPKSPDVTSLIIDYKSMVQIKRIDSTNYSLFCELKELKMLGDVMYREINIAHILQPDFVSFRINIMRIDTPEVSVYSQTYSQIPMNGHLGYYTILKTTFQDTLKQREYHAVVDGLKLTWGEPARERFLKGVALIHDYYSSNRIINEQIEVLKSIDIEKIERVAFNNIVLKDVEKEYEVLMLRDFQNELNLWNTDPISFVKRMEDFYKEISTLRFQINKKLEYLDRLYYEKGLEKYKSEKFDSARHYYQKAVEYNPVFVPALTELAWLDYKKGLLDSAAMKLNFIYNFTILAPADEVRLGEVTRFIMSSIDETVQRRILVQDFTIAQELLELTMEICAVAPHLACYDPMDKLMAQVKYGLYKSLLVVVDKAIENRRFEIARIYILQAIAYQQENSVYIITSIEAEKYYTVLYGASLRDIEQLNIKKMYQRAFETAEWLKNYCDSLGTIDCSSMIRPWTVALKGLYGERMSKIETDISKKNYVAADTRMKLLTDFVSTYDEIDFDARYRKAEIEVQTFYYHGEISEAMSNLEYEFMEPAWAHFMKAYDIQEKYKLPKFEYIDSLSQIAGMPTMTKFYRKIISSERRMPISELQQSYDEYAFMIRRTGTPLNDSLLSLQNNLFNLIGERICDSLKNDISIYLYQFDSLVNQQKFIEADELLTHAVSVCQSNTSCRLPIEQVLEMKVKVRDGVKYENEYTELMQLIEQKKWGEAISQYFIVDVLGSSQLLFMWGVKKQALPEFIAVQKNSEFLLTGFDFFMEQKKWDDAFTMLEELRKLDYSQVQTIAQQTKLGQKLAVRDKIANAEANFKINILKYTEGEEYFMYFSKSYRKTWRKN